VESETQKKQLDPEEIFKGFLDLHQQLDALTKKFFIASTQLYSLSELLVAKGIMGIEELDERKLIVEKRLRKAFEEADIGVKIQDLDADKYSIPEEARIDCERRTGLCKAACCRLSFSLSWQDVKEGMRWSLEKPFMNARYPDEYCQNFQKPG
jgi:hypothetical protein